MKTSQQWYSNNKRMAFLSRCWSSTSSPTLYASSSKRRTRCRWVNQRDRGFTVSHGSPPACRPHKSPCEAGPCFGQPAGAVWRTAQALAGLATRMHIDLSIWQHRSQV
jgi:hypothetical protein